MAGYTFGGSDDRGHLYAKLEGVLDSISESFKNLPKLDGPISPSRLSEIIDDEKLAEELELFWPRVFLHRFRIDKGNYLSGGEFFQSKLCEETLLNCCIYLTKRSSSDYGYSKFTLKVIDQCSPEALRIPNQENELPLVYAVKLNLQDISVKLLDMMTIDEIKSHHQKIVKYAQKNRNEDLMRAIEDKISYQPAVTLSSIVSNSQRALPSFDDPRELVQAALNSGRSSDALAIGSQIMNACTAFFNSVQQKSNESLVLGIEASASLDSMIARIQKTKEDLAKITDNPKSLAIPTGIMAPAINYARRILPSLDPHHALKGDFNDIQHSIQTSLETSQRVMKGYEDFQIANPAIREQINKLDQALEEAITRIDDEATNATEGYQDPSRLRLRKIFVSIQANAKATGGFVDINAGIAGTNLDTEVEFATAVLSLQTALNATVSNANFTISRIKSSLTPELARDAQQTIRVQLREAQENLHKMEVLLEMRQDQLQNLTPFGRTSQALAFVPGDRAPI